MEDTPVTLLPCVLGWHPRVRSERLRGGSAMAEVPVVLVLRGRVFGPPSAYAQLWGVVWIDTQISQDTLGNRQNP